MSLVADMDGDGDLDILSIGWGHPRVLLYENRAVPEPGGNLLVLAGVLGLIALCRLHGDRGARGRVWDRVG